MVFRYYGDQAFFFATRKTHRVAYVLCPMNYNSVQGSRNQKTYFFRSRLVSQSSLFFSPAEKRRREFRGRVCSKWCAMQRVAFVEAPCQFVRLVIALRGGKVLIVKTEESGFLGKEEKLSTKHLISSLLRSSYLRLLQQPLFLGYFTRDLLSVMNVDFCRLFLLSSDHCFQLREEETTIALITTPAAPVLGKGPP